MRPQIWQSKEGVYEQVWKDEEDGEMIPLGDNLKNK